MAKGKIEGMNTASEGVARCIRASYYKVSIANLIHTDGRAASGVIEYEE